MATRTVRLDDEAERNLREVRRKTGLPISEALKRGLRTLKDQLDGEAAQSPWDVYRHLDPGPGGSAIAPSTGVKRAVREAIRKKVRR